MTHTAGWRAREGKARTKKPGPARTRANKPLVPDQRLGQDIVETTGYEVADLLRQIAADPSSPSAARVNAIRTLAEMDGRIGRHQIVPDREAPSLATLSRDALVDELERLRTAVSLGLVR